MEESQAEPERLHSWPLTRAWELSIKGTCEYAWPHVEQPAHPYCGEGERRETTGTNNSKKRESGGEPVRRHRGRFFSAIVSTPFNWTFSPEHLGMCCVRSVRRGRLAACWLPATGGPCFPSGWLCNYQQKVRRCF